jgi:predicted TIM-barrel fold metal-dependent hydrolase
LLSGWHEDKTKEMFLKSIVLEVISLFGAGRCMFGSNYHISSTVSDSDGTYATGPSIHEMFEHFQSWVSELPQHHQDMLFSGTATDFYRLSSSYI